MSKHPRPAQALLPQVPGSPASKGLRSGQVGLLAIVVMGISTVAPAYAITSSLGPTTAAVGPQIAIVLIIGFIPMFLVALAYRELNSVIPDSGTTFTWVSRAFGPWAGWLGGWGFLAANIIVLSNLAAVAVEFGYAFLAEASRRPELARLSGEPWINIGTCLLLMAAATWLSLRGLATSRKVQTVLLAFQVAVLVLYSVAAISRSAKRLNTGEGLSFGWEWFDLSRIPDASALATALSLSIFLYWGWDMCLTMNEETKAGHRTAGLGAAVTALTVLVLYLMTAVASLMLAGGTELTPRDGQENALGALAAPALGPFAILLSLAVLSSSSASLQTTMIGPARMLQAMSFYRALPEKLTVVDPKGVPRLAVITAAACSAGFYVFMRLVSENVLNDTITALGMLVCFYYALTAFSCVFFFRGSWFSSARNFLLRLLIPLLGGISLSLVFLQTAADSFSPAYGSGSALGCVGLVFIIGVGILVLGCVLMVLYRLYNPEFFSRTGAPAVP